MSIICQQFKCHLFTFKKDAVSFLVRHEYYATFTKISNDMDYWINSVLDM
jgi:hypothetical protein